ncbi:MAG: hypothetical protein HFJ55_06465 [Clostridia bacterium]|jgi:hypothetical protein|nr:hypothetical protein [Clostridia bacterium]
MEEKSLRVVGTDKTFFNKITNTLNKLLIPTQIGINGMRISMKRNALIKAFEAAQEDNSKQDAADKKYEDAYTAYLEALDKYVLDTIYKKVKNETATKIESTALSQYYGIVQLKESEYVEYKYRKQKYLIELDKETVKASGKEKMIEKYEKFYIEKQDTLYKGLLKNYSIKLADNTNIYDSTKEWIYIKIFDTLEDYIKNILPLKIEEPNLENIVKEYEKYEQFSIGKLDARDNIEKNMILLGISRNLFTHSLPLVVAEQCYMKLIKDARTLVQDTKIATKREKAYTMLFNLIEDYHIRLLSTKVYWENSRSREEFKSFLEKYKIIEKLKEIDFIEYVKQKEILFIKEEIRKIKEEKIDYTQLIKYYKRKLVDYGEMKEIRETRKVSKSYKRNKQNIGIKELISA